MKLNPFKKKAKPAQAVESQDKEKEPLPGFEDKKTGVAETGTEPAEKFEFTKESLKADFEKFQQEKKAKEPKQDKPDKKPGETREHIPLRGRLEEKFKKLHQMRAEEMLALRKKKRFSLTVRGFARTINLQDYLEKAGMERADSRLTSKKIFRFNIFLCVALSGLIVLFNIIFQKGLLNLLVFLLGFWISIFFLLLALIWAAYLFYLDMKIFQRTKAVEEVFPDFLQLTSANISAGMPIDQALWYAVRPGFGVLAKEIESVAKNTMAGEDLGVALTTFANKYNSKTIQRSINLLLEGMAAGGEMADLLNKIALNIDETKILRKEMAANVTTYVIFITFATIIAAPILFGLATQLLMIIKEITSKLGTNIASGSTFFSLGFSSNSIKTSDFKLFSYLMLIISSISSACIVSVIKKGRVKEGITSIPVFVIVSVFLYTMALVIVGSLFKNFI